MYLINEFRTSKLCNHCHKELKPYYKEASSKSKKPKRKWVKSNKWKAKKPPDKIKSSDKEKPPDKEKLPAKENPLDKVKLPGDKEEKPEEKGKMMKVWGLVCCANEECRPYTASKKGLVFPYGIKTYNRDTNAVLNMRYIVECLIKTGKRPIAYTRHK